ncbi:MAG: hypothetical protein CM15mV99_340 [Caudoviricetes sp.]|nr:MAG: hypothetical protein CM15mV99_340 [Caudoviricetes sp.]
MGKNTTFPGNLQAPVTKKKIQLVKEQQEKKIFVLMKGMPGALKDKKGSPTRKALALKKNGGVN